MLEGALLLLLAFIAGAVGFLIMGRLPLSRKIEEAEREKPATSRHPHEDVLPYYIDANGERSYLAFAGADHMPKAMYYHPQTNKREYFDCHNEVLKEGQELIRWPNPLKRKVESLCEGCVVFPNT